MKYFNFKHSKGCIDFTMMLFFYLNNKNKNTMMLFFLFLFIYKLNKKKILKTNAVILKHNFVTVILF